MQPLHTINRPPTQQKHRENRKTLPWEHHIGCQMCRTSLSNSTKNFFYSMDSSDSSEKVHATSPQKNHATSFFYFLGTFEKCNLTHLTTDVMFSGQRFAILAMFSKHRPSGTMLSISRFVRPSVCSLLRYRLSVFLPPLPEVGWPIFLEILNPWGKEMEKIFCLRFQFFSLEVV